MTALAKASAQPTIDGLERVLLEGDLGGLTQDQRIQYYSRVCQSVGLNPLTQPFEYLRLNGKTVLYAKRACTDQLRNIHKISIAIVSREKLDGIYVVTARATTPDGRADENIGAVPIENLKGESLANALMKAETKAKRRVTLAISGLSLLDETEVESIPASQRQAPQRKQAPVRTLDDIANDGPEDKLRQSVEQAAPAAPAEPERTVDAIASQYNNGFSAAAEFGDISPTGELDEYGLQVPPGDCPRFSPNARGGVGGKTYLEAPGFLREVVLKDPRFQSEPALKQVWANYSVARHEIRKLLEQEQAQ